jgi:hypothetical protein
MVLFPSRSIAKSSEAEHQSARAEAPPTPMIASYLPVGGVNKLPQSVFPFLPPSRISRILHNKSSPQSHSPIFPTCFPLFLLLPPTHLLLLLPISPGVAVFKDIWICEGEREDGEVEEEGVAEVFEGLEGRGAGRHCVGFEQMDGW